MPQVSKVQRTGVLQPWVTLAYSQDQLASYNVVPSKLEQLLSDRNIIGSAGMLNAAGTNVNISASGEFRDASEIGDVIAGKSASGSPFYLRDLVSVSRDYQGPAVVVELPHLAGRVRLIASQPRHHARDLHAIGRADRRFRRRNRIAY